MSPDEWQVWLNHFEYHGQHPRALPDGLSDLLLPQERRLIASSIAAFQLGEQSEGATLLGTAQRFAHTHRLPALVRIIELLIREERRHARLLREFMADHAIQLKASDWTDRVFRRVRRLAGLELYLSVLLSAELIGNVYYRALEAATGCQRLKALCRTLICDELAHLGFESQFLLLLRARRSAAARAAIRLAHLTFFAMTVRVVWWMHRSVLRHVGYDARSFRRICVAQYSFYLEPLSAAAAVSIRARARLR